MITRKILAKNQILLGDSYFIAYRDGHEFDYLKRFKRAYSLLLKKDLISCRHNSDDIGVTFDGKLVIGYELAKLAKWQPKTPPTFNWPKVLLWASRRQLARRKDHL